MKAQAQGHLERLDELDEGHPLRGKPRGARGEHIPHDADGAEKRDFTASERRRLAARNEALPDGSYPIENEEDLHNAAVLARTGHGDVEAARRLIARRARDLGVKNPLDETKNVNPREVGGRLVLNPFRILAERGVNVKTIGNPYENAPDPQARSEQGQGIATRHRDLIQHDANQVDGVANLRTARGNTMDLGVSDSTPGGFSHEGTARVELYDARGQAGAPVPLHPYAHPFRPDYRTAPLGQSNGTHDHNSQQAACTTPCQSMKSASPYEVMRAFMRGELS